MRFDPIRKTNEDSLQLARPPPALGAMPPPVVAMTSALRDVPFAS